MWVYKILDIDIRDNFDKIKEQLISEQFIDNGNKTFSGNYFDMPCVISFKFAPDNTIYRMEFSFDSRFTSDIWELRTAFIEKYSQLENFYLSSIFGTLMNTKNSIFIQFNTSDSCANIGIVNTDCLDKIRDFEKQQIVEKYKNL